MNKAYSRINNGNGWEDFPSDKTAVDERNLNHMEIGIDEIDNRVLALDDTKATKVEVSTLFKEVSYDKQTGIITFTRKNGATVTIDTPMEKIQTGIYYDPETEMLTMPLIDGTTIGVDLSRLITELEFLDSDTIAFSVSADGKVAAIVKEGSIQEKHLQPNYLADIRVEAAKAQVSVNSASESAASADAYAKKSQSYAVGTGSVRPNEATDNAKYYYEQSKDIYDNFSSAGNVTGVKGNAESDYRTGNVNITPANIGSPTNEYIDEHFAADYASAKYSNFSAGSSWRRIAEYKTWSSGGYSAQVFVSCDIIIKRGWNSPPPEFHKIQLIGSGIGMQFICVADRGNMLFKKIRLVWVAAELKYYLEVYYSGTYANPVTVTIDNAAGDIGYKCSWKTITPVEVPENADGSEILAEKDISTQFTLESLAKADGSNVSGTWEGLTAGSATKAARDSDGNVIKDTYWDKGKSLILAEELEIGSASVTPNANIGFMFPIKAKSGYKGIAAFPRKTTSNNILWVSCELTKSGVSTMVNASLTNISNTAINFTAYATVLYVRDS